MLSFSTEERDFNSSTEDFATNAQEWAVPVTTTAAAAASGVGVSVDTYRGIVMPELGSDDMNFGNQAWDGHLLNL